MSRKNKNDHTQLDEASWVFVHVVTTRHLGQVKVPGAATELQMFIY
jgi:hypothetical protein